MVVEVAIHEGMMDFSRERREGKWWCQMVVDGMLLGMSCLI